MAYWNGWKTKKQGKQADKTGENGIISTIRISFK